MTDCRSLKTRVWLRGDNLLRWLLVNNISQSEFARREGISGVAISNALRGIRAIGPRVRAAIWEGTDLDWDELFSRSPPEQASPEAA